MLRTQNVHALEDSRRPGPSTASPTGFSQSTRPSPLGTLLTAAAASLQSCPILCDPTRLPRPWDSPGKNTGVGCHFLLMKVKSESEVVQSCPTISDPMDCSLPGSAVHGIFQARVLEWGAIAFSIIKADTEYYTMFTYINYSFKY